MKTKKSILKTNVRQNDFNNHAINNAEKFMYFLNSSLVISSFAQYILL